MEPIRHTSDNRLMWRLVSCVILAAAPATAQDAPPWKTGAALRQQLAASTSIVWSERPLRDGLMSLSQSAGVAIFLDRRVDPSQPMTLTVTNQPLERLLAEIAAQASGDAALVGSVVYVGPGDIAGKLATLATLRRQEATRLPAAVRSRVLRASAWQWNDLAQPRRLLDELAAEAGVEVTNADALPHDLWPAASLPPLAWSDRLSLLLAGFGLTFEFTGGGQSMLLVPMPADVRLTKTYTPRGTPAQTAAELRRLIPQADIRIEQGQIVVAASQEEHSKIERLLRGEQVRTTTRTPGREVYSLTVENQPAGAVVRRVAEQLNKELKYDPQIVEKLRQNVTFSVKDVSLDELLTTTLKPLGLTYKLDAASLEVLTAP